MGVSVRWEEEGDDSKSVYLGPEVQGELIEVKYDVGPNNSKIYSLKLDDGTIVNVWGTTVLDDAMIDPDTAETIGVGAIVRITCLGKVQGKTGPSKQPGKGYWSFEVQYAIPSPAFKAAQKSGTAKKQSAGAALAEAGESTKEAEEESSEEDEY